MKKKVIILCTGNSCRSQMAEGFLRKMAGDEAEIYSAGIEAHGLNPGAVEVMRESGIDISMHRSNSISEYQHIPFDFIITVCDHALENCPYLPGKGLRLHLDFPDPARAGGSEEEVMKEFRRVRDMIASYCSTFVKEHLGQNAPQ